MNAVLDINRPKLEEFKGALSYLIHQHDGHKQALEFHKSIYWYLFVRQYPEITGALLLLAKNTEVNDGDFDYNEFYNDLDDNYKTFIQALYQMKGDAEKLDSLIKHFRRNEDELCKTIWPFKNSFEGYDDEYSYLIKGYLGEKSLVMLYGDSGSYKTFLALTLAFHVALGLKWNGCQVKQANVLYIAGEGGVGVSRRIKALAIEYGTGELINSFKRLDHAVSIASSGDLDKLTQSINYYAADTRCKFGLVVIDTLARCFGGGDENSTEQMNTFVAACDRLKENTGATVLIVHHTGTSDKKRARGSSVLRAAVDFEYRVDRVDQETPAFTLTNTKNKDDGENPREMFTLKEISLFTDSDGDEVTSLVCSAAGEEPPEEDDPTSSKKSNTLNFDEQSVWQIVRCRQKNGESTNYQNIRDDLKAQAVDEKDKRNVGKSVGRWVAGCVEKGCIINQDGQYKTIDKQ